MIKIQTVKLLYKTLLFSVVSFCLFFLYFYSTAIYEYFLINHLRDRVVLVGNKTMTSHGTGFFIKGASGNTYILTNAHVCQISEDGWIYVQTRNIKPLPRRILKISETSDLCIIEPVLGITALKSAKDYSTFEEVTSFGFPKSYGFVPFKGRILHEKITMLLDFLIKNEKDLKRCSNPKNFIVKMDSQIVCGVKIKSVETTITIFGGNSGSPVVNVWGNVVGIVFATDLDLNWGIIVDIFEIHNFLKDY